MPENNQDTLAMEMLKELKATNKRKDIIILVILALWFATIAGLIWYNSLPVDDEVVTVENSDGNANYVGNDLNGVINNGESDSTQKDAR